MAIPHANLVLFIRSKERRGVPLSPAEQRVLDRYQQTQEVARRGPRAALSSPPPLGPGLEPLSPAGAEDAVFDGMSVSNAEFRARVAQHRLTMPIGSEDRLMPPRPPRSPALEASERRLLDEQEVKRAAAAARLAEGAVDARSAPAAEVAARMRSLGIDPLLVGAVREIGKPLPPPSFPVNGRRGR